ncbi:hypothetical protein D918_08609 [Trichuris suis]|nr:hypothetical protein D918_08609 [Trichuris suis]
METQLERNLDFERQTKKEELDEPNEKLIGADTSSKLSGTSDVTKAGKELEQSVYGTDSEQSVQNVGQYCSSGKMADESVEDLDVNSCFDRKVTVFRIENERLEEPDDSFYMVTTSDALAIQKRLQETSYMHLLRCNRRYCSSLRKRLSNPPLVSQRKLRELELDRKRSSWKVTIIKVKLPQQWVLQAAFLSDEPVKNVYEFVRSCLANPEAAFALRSSTSDPDNYSFRRRIDWCRFIAFCIASLAWISCRNANRGCTEARAFENGYLFVDGTDSVTPKVR